MSVEKNLECYRDQITLLEQEIDPRCAGKMRAEDRTLGQCLAEMHRFRSTVGELIEDGTVSFSPTSHEGFV